MEESIILSFESANYAMQTEVYLKNEGFNLQIMPTPREITLSCGLSIKTSVDNLDKINEFVDKKKIRIKAIYKLIVSGKQRFIEKLS